MQLYFATQPPTPQYNSVSTQQDLYPSKCSKFGYILHLRAVHLQAIIICILKKLLYRILNKVIILKLHYCGKENGTYPADPILECKRWVFHITAKVQTNKIITQLHDVSQYELHNFLCNSTAQLYFDLSYKAKFKARQVTFEQIRFVKLTKSLNPSYYHSVQ